MSRESGVSPATVQRIWHAFGLKSHLQDTFKLSTDPHFVDKVRDVVGLYLCRKLRERGAAVCIVGEGKTPPALRNASDHFSE